MIKRPSSLILFLASALLLASFSPLPGHAQSSDPQIIQSVRENVGNVTIDWSEGIVRVTGTGAPPDRGSASQRRLMAERAAIADAYRQLAEAINGVRVNAETVVKDYVTESDTIRLQVSALIRGAQKIDRRFLSDGSIEVDMAVKLYSQQGLSGILQPQKNAAPPPPVPDTVKPDPNPGDYTGLIIDCRGLGLKPAMSPALLNQSGGEIYVGHLPIDPDFVINRGIVAYSTSLNEARRHERAGNSPLIVKAVAASGNFKADAVLPEKETQQVLGLEAKAKVLSLAHVIFVL
ncbi:hypothetical protein COW36_17345 [bacterium (Candidatus Blackallbacteria) CG17_big_fil_post_rev_8_21_14_2_50_48_46]|uniref:LPP20 lipoprotein n=1 Tax=bacterium (Candidatus Blackallbacteria) CG17_big_fil_post_rev_8_21_14_2_50_48_46 TaxID=2014261 RepID=A0A2M7G0X5_9BACT|nr:MAG: hypothetical protein COW64_01385 [bacterium (Candidatus Blackallbacteria) CG18_big_fil_WC_8_21_14_2_50_49_26]PIW15187.1 MAG: hypothetical protein COW36_17345 [bacterium (Candidatus Blackallbacteria) CG17_big_fil_post_rev_8_21_14_2_50_48_46]PIW44774.1 MAG: hypothetical protein COW20_22680 [bacterium (Candidatus Blackallbacteria) CG13_big_fil_rev_8_21_14_2_50_49_14]